MIAVDFHTHFYRSFYEKKLEGILGKSLAVKLFSDLKEMYIVLASYSSDETLKDIANFYDLTVSVYRDIEYSLVSFKNINFFLVQAYQIRDPFGVEFTKLAGNYFLTYAPLKYSFGIRREIFTHWQNLGRVIYTPSTFSYSGLWGSDLLPYNSEIQYLGSVGTIFKKFSLEDFLNIPPPLGVYNFYNRRLFRIIFSQRIFTRISGRSSKGL